jgi:hypothetical protein
MAVCVIRLEPTHVIDQVSHTLTVNIHIYISYLFLSIYIKTPTFTGPDYLDSTLGCRNLILFTKVFRHNLRPPRP